LKKLVYIISDVDKVLAFEWITPFLSQKFDLTFILIGKKNSALAKFLLSNKVSCQEVSDLDYPSWAAKWVQTFRLLFFLKPTILHTHLWRANLLGLTAGWLLRVPKRILTRHHATVHYSQHPAGLKWDKLCNWLATHVIAPSKKIEKLLTDWDNAKPEKVIIINHGFKLEYLSDVEPERSKALERKYSIKRGEKWPIVGVVARYVEWKGIQYIIPAFAKLKQEYPNAHLVLANASGDYNIPIEKLLKILPSNSYTEILFEEDLAALYRLFDVYVHVPINELVEAFGQTYVEALAAGIPSVFTLSGVACEFVRHGHNALVATYQDSDSIYGSIKSLLEDGTLRDAVVKEGRRSASEFDLKEMVNKLAILYNSQG
jgi:glycosyltransferase involved in cell wall biosynthesis